MHKTALARVRAVVVGVALVVGAAAAQSRAVAGDGQEPLRLSPTVHPPIPLDISSMWFATATATSMGPALTNFVKGVRLLEDRGDASAALPLVGASALATTPLADYARYYTGLSLMKLGRFEAADNVFGELASRQLEGHLPEDAALRQAEVREARKDFKGAVTIYESLLGRKLSEPPVVWLKLGLAAARAGQPNRSLEALRRVYYEYPTSAEAAAAATELDRQHIEASAAQAPKDLARANALFAARRWAPARASYEAAKPFVLGTERARLEMRLAACEVGLGRYLDGRDRLKPLLDGPVEEEASFHYVAALRGLKVKDEYRKRSREFVASHPSSVFAEQVLDNLASALLVDDEDEQADAVFRQLVDQYPAGRFAERAAWKAGWWAYRRGRFQDAVDLFDRGAARFPRSDYRPSWLYWSGRAALQSGDTATGISRLRLTATDYRNSYYGRLALTNLASRSGGVVAPTLRRQPLPTAVSTAPRIALLLATGLNVEAMRELQYAQQVWGDSPQLLATIALTHRRLGNVRAGINAMKRAYPQYLAAGGETLPREILQVIFPLDYWPLLQKYAAQRGLDPHVVAALVVQESNFDPVVVSHAKAYGLMQVLPSTGRSYARKLGVRPFSTSHLTDAEINVRLGTQIFADSIRKFGGVHFALAAYNAGDSRVVAWQRERPGLPQDEFIDDIPFPETQNYVKRILGTAEDYRLLYGSR